MQKIQIPSQSPFLLRDVRNGAGSPPPIMLDGELYLPQDRERPFPAVVISQGLGGVKQARERRYARLLTQHGHAAILFDGFVSRGKHRFSDTIRALRVSETMLLADAFAGLSYLAGRHDIRSDAISIMGFSYGGMITVLAAYEQLAQLFLPGGPRFASHISYYGCSIPRMENPRTTGAPVVKMLGERDANVDIGRSEAIAGDLEEGGSPVALTVFENVYHQWDGSDVEKRFVDFNLANCRMRIGVDDEVRDERTGIRMSGRTSRTAILGLSASRQGYFIQKDDTTRRLSDEILLTTLAEVGQDAPVQPQGHAAIRRSSQEHQRAISDPPCRAAL